MRATHLCGEAWEGSHDEVVGRLEEHKAFCPAEHAAEEARQPQPDPYVRTLPLPWRGLRG